MASPYVSGPVHMYVSTGDISNVPRVDLPRNTTFNVLPLGYPPCSAIRYLGTCEQAPRILVNPRYKPITASFSGGDDSAPIDFAGMGEDALISGTLTYWNELVFEQCVSRPLYNARTPGVGGNRGKLMIHQGLTFCLWLQFPYASKAYGTSLLMPGGYRFPTAWMLGPEDYSIGTSAAKRSIILHGHPTYERQSTLADGITTWRSHFLLYDALMAYIPSVPPVGTDGALTTCGGGDIGGGAPGFDAVAGREIGGWPARS